MDELPEFLNDPRLKHTAFLATLCEVAYKEAIKDAIGVIKSWENGAAINSVAAEPGSTLQRVCDTLRETLSQVEEEVFKLMDKYSS